VSPAPPGGPRAGDPGGLGGNEAAAGPTSTHGPCGVSARRGSDALEPFERRGAAAYLGEPVTVLEHSLQCAALAVAAGSAPELVAACLLHDVGWLLGRQSARDAAEHRGEGHAERGAAFVAGWFPPAVHEPVRLHVMAKRWLSSVEPGSVARLSDESRRTLELQGGPLDAGEAAAFASLAHAQAAVSLRRFDDAAKEPGRRCAPLGEYAGLLDLLAAGGPET
jgi:gamma-butyrobetaine dioxygenase